MNETRKYRVEYYNRMRLNDPKSEVVLAKSSGSAKRIVKNSHTYEIVIVLVTENI